MDLGLGASQQLQQKLTFHMIQSLKMLQVGSLQLAQMFRAEMEQNPLLDVEDDVSVEDEYFDDDDNIRERDEDEHLTELDCREDSIDWEEYLEEGFDIGASFNEEIDPNADRYDTSPVYEETLEEHLEEQIKERNLPERTKLLVQFIIGSLDGDGYLRLSTEDITEATDASIIEVEEALNVLWGFDPLGVGARDLRECMMLQMRARKSRVDSIAMKIITDHWALFEKLKIVEISRVLSIEPRLTQEAIDILKTLNPKPGYQYGADKSSTIIPDLIVKEVDGEFIATLNERSVPSLCINKGYADMMRRGSTAKKDVKEYIRDKFNSATWFIKAIEQRRTTILRVMYAIIECQTAFFKKGPQSLVPLGQKHIAEMIKMDVSTISRVANGKYAQTPHGIFELKYFFARSNDANKKSAKPTDDDAENTGANAYGDVSTEHIKSRIRQLIDDEDSKSPLSDQKIAEVLKDENLPIARRTAAKYREQMKIPSARMRQKYE